MRGRFAVSKQAAQKLDGERFNLRKLNELELGNSIRLILQTGLENISDSDDINRAWQSTKENIKTSAKERLGVQELEQHKPWFDECLDFLDQRR